MRSLRLITVIVFEVDSMEIHPSFDSKRRTPAYRLPRRVKGGCFEVSRRDERMEQNECRDDDK